MNAGLLAALGGAAGSIREERIKKQDRELEREDAMKRAKLAQELQLQLLEKKAQLAQKYPTYQHFVTNPRDNSVTGFTEYGQASLLKEGDADLAAAYDYSKKATEDQQLLQQRVAESQIAANEGRAAASRASGLLDEARRLNPEKYRAPPKETKKPAKPSSNAIKAAAMKKYPDRFVIERKEEFDPVYKATRDRLRLEAILEAEQEFSGERELDDVDFDSDEFR